MGTKRTTRGPNARRRSVFATQAFPQGSSPIFRGASGVSNSGSCLDEATPEARVSPEIPPVSNGAVLSDSPTEGSDGVGACGEIERPLPKAADEPAVLCKDGYLESAAVSKVKNLDGESTTEAEGQSKSRNLDTHEATVKPAAVTDETGERNVTSGPASGETADVERRKRSLLEQQSRSGKKVGDNQKRELSEDPDQDALNIKKHDHGDGSFQAPGKMVIILCLLAAPNCPWRNGRKSRISKA
ncbi:hypothetical protein GW17_00034606 [Ensete ventricosum]|nr:hypothetical protein GW17_00034606 [Ensete ventricosum]